MGLTEAERWAEGSRRARERLQAELAEIARREAEKGGEVKLPPAQHAGPYLSVLASPHLLSYPAGHLEWLSNRAGEQGWPAVIAIHLGTADSR